MGGPWKYVAVFAAVVFSAVCLAACGSDGDDSTQSVATGSEATSPASPPSDEDSSNKEQRGSSGESGESESENGAPSGDAGRPAEDGAGESTAEVRSSGPERGTVSSNSAAFQKYSGKGKLHLAEFGEEASGGDLSEVDAIVQAYLQATGGGEWQKACAYLSAMVKAQIAQVVQQSSSSSSSSCGDALQNVTKTFSPPGEDSPIYASEGVASLRIKEGGLAGGGAGFALFHGSDGEDHWIAVKAEGGEWTILSTSPQPFS
jgi:hypothetical protein